MTLTTQTPKEIKTGNSSAREFSFTFVINQSSDMVVTHTVTATGVETVLSEGTGSTNYSVAVGTYPGNGTVKYPHTGGTLLPSTATITLSRIVDIDQDTDLVNQGAWSPSTIENAFDYSRMIDLQQQNELDRSLKLPISTDTSTISGTLPPAVADSYIKWNSAGTAFENTTTVAGQSLAGDGTVSLPYYSYSADPNTGMYRIGADNIGLAVGGSKVVDVTSTGINSTVIGATTPAAGTFSSITSGGAVLSDTDSTDSLGSTGVRWLKAWIDSIQTTANIDVGADLIVAGNLTVNGTTVTNSVTNQVIADPLIELNNGAGSNANDLGIVMERGSTGDNAFLGWDESGDHFVAATTTATGASTGNISYSYAPFKCSAITATSGTLAGITSLGLNAGATITAGILDEDAMGSNSAVALATQQSIKAYADNNAPENGVKFAFETSNDDADQGAGKVWLNSGNTILYVDDVEAGGVSVNSWVDTWDDVTNAVARGYVYIASYGTTNAIKVFKLTGAVVSASTYSKCPCSLVLSVGTISDGDNIGLTFVPSGADGAGDLASANNLSDVASAATSRTNLGLAIGTNVQAYHARLADIAALGVTNNAVVIGDGSDLVLESGSTLKTSLGLTIGTDVQAFDSDTTKNDTVNTFTKAQSGSITALSDGSTIAVDLALNNHFSVTLGGNRALGNPTNIVAGTSGSIFLTQDGTGSRTLSYGSYYDFAAGTAPTLTTTAAKIDRIDYIARTTTSLHCVFTGDLS